MKLLTLLAISLILVGCDTNSEFNPSKEYCDMWKVWHDSNGEYGWPDKDRKYFTECEAR